MTKMDGKETSVNYSEIKEALESLPHGSKFLLVFPSGFKFNMYVDHQSKEIYSSYLPARTIKEISGRCIPSVPVGTKFLVGKENIVHCAQCLGLAVSAVWNTEYELTEE